MPRVAFTTLGCKVNQYETETIEGLFKQRGYQVTGFDQPADVYVINTCSVTHLGERKSRQLIRRAARTNPEATVVVTGCYAQASPEQIEKIEGVDLIVGTQQRQRIVELTEEAAASHDRINVVSDIMSAQEFEDIPLFDAPGRTRAFLKIQEGCTNYCTYCIIPYTRGPLRSRSLESIAHEADKLVNHGFKEIVLTGIHLGAYGRDSGSQISLADAVRKVLSINGLLRLRLGSLESVEVTGELIELMKTDRRLCPHLHLPLQSGDDHILLSMNREYSTDEYRRLILYIQQQIPDIAITTDIIVGFPGETEERFEKSMRFVKDMDFAKVHIFPYSRRAGTPAADFTGQVPEPEKRRRSKAMEILAEEKAKAFRKRFIGQKMDVLFEAAEGAFSSGFTGNYLHIFTDARVDAGKLQAVKIEKLYEDGLLAKVFD